MGSWSEGSILGPMALVRAQHPRPMEIGQRPASLDLWSWSEAASQTYGGWSEAASQTYGGWSETIILGVHLERFA